MKRMILIACVMLFTICNIYATSDFLTKKSEEKQTGVLMEKKFQIDESNIWETDKSTSDESGNASSKNIFSDDDKKLYAPPPGEEGNPQKIVAPLGNSEVAVFLLLSAFSIGFYWKKRNKVDN